MKRWFSACLAFVAIHSLLALSSRADIVLDEFQSSLVLPLQQAAPSGPLTGTDEIAHDFFGSITRFSYVIGWQTPPLVPDQWVTADVNASEQITFTATDSADMIGQLAWFSADAQPLDFDSTGFSGFRIPYVSNRATDAHVFMSNADMGEMSAGNRFSFVIPAGVGVLDIPFSSLTEPMYGATRIVDGMVVRPEFPPLDPTSVDAISFSVGEANESNTGLEIALDSVTIIAEVTLPCDADGDGDCWQADINAMYSEFGAPGRFDFDGNGVVNGADVPGWLSAASSSDNPSNPNNSTFMLGDVDLNGNVDSTDLGVVLNNFNSTTELLWWNGNFDGNHVIDSGDLGLLLNKFGFQSVSQVPEPILSVWPLLLLPLIIRQCKSKKRTQFRSF